MNFWSVSFAHLWLNSSKSVISPSKYQNYGVFIQKIIISRVIVNLN